MDSEGQGGRGIGRRQALMGIGAVAAAPSMIAGGVAATMAGATSAGLGVTSQALGWMRFGPQLAETAFGLSDYFGGMSILPQVINGGMSSRELVKNLASVLGGPDAVFAGSGLSVKDILSPGAKFAYFLHNGGDEADALWEQNPMFTSASSDWSMMQQLFGDMGLSGDSEVPLNTLNRVLSERTIGRFGGHMRQAFFKDPKGFAKAMAEHRNVLSDDNKARIAKLMEPTKEEIESGEVTPDWNEHYAQAERSTTADEELLHYDVYALDHEGEANRQFLFACKRDTSIRQIQEKLTPEHFDLSPEKMDWDGHVLSIPADCQAAKDLALTGGIAHAPGHPSLRINSAKHEAQLGTSAGILSFGS